MLYNFNDEEFEYDISSSQFKDFVRKLLSKPNERENLVDFIYDNEEEFFKWFEEDFYDEFRDEAEREYEEQKLLKDDKPYNQSDFI